MRRLFFLVFSVACSGSPEPVEPVEPPGVVEDDLGDGTLDLPAEAASRVHRRMSIPQVRASMERVTGGITWTSGSTDLWEQYASTLGVPDFQERTVEDRSASVLFNKFLDDAASAACDEWVTGELASSFFTETSLGDTEPEPVRRNIAALRRRIQGRPFEPDSDDVAAYHGLFERVMTRTDSPTQAWGTVCVALFTHPSFYAY